MHEAVGDGHPHKHRVRVERGIYRQPNGKFVVCFMRDGKPRFRTVGSDLELARAQRLSFARAARFGVVAAAPRLRLEMVAGWWLERYERRVGQWRAAGANARDPYLLPEAARAAAARLAADPRDHGG